MELVYLCTGKIAISVAVRKHTQEATARKVKFWFLEECLSLACLSYLIPTEISFVVILLHTDLFLQTEIFPF